MFGFRKKKSYFDYGYLQEVAKMNASQNDTSFFPEQTEEDKEESEVKFENTQNLWDKFEQAEERLRQEDEWGDNLGYLEYCDFIKKTMIKFISNALDKPKTNKRMTVAFKCNYPVTKDYIERYVEFYHLGKVTFDLAGDDDLCFEDCRFKGEINFTASIREIFLATFMTIQEIEYYDKESHVMYYELRNFQDTNTEFIESQMRKNLSRRKDNK